MFNLGKRIKRAISVACVCALLLETNITNNMNFIKAESQESLFVLDKYDGLDKYVGNNTEVELPLEVDGRTVKGISNAFMESNIKKVTIPAGFPRIDANAFRNCTELEEVVLEGNVNYVGGSAFKGCSSLKQINVDCEEVSDNAFENCTNLTSVVFTGMKKMGKEVFKGCTSLREVSIPQNVEYLNCSSFLKCESVEITVYGLNTRLSSETYMPKTVTIVCYKGAKIEEDCKKNGIAVSYLEDTVTPQPTFVTSEPTSFTQNGFTVTKEGTLIKYSGNSLDNIVIPNEICGIQVETIGREAFEGLNIKNVKIPDSVKKISASAFAFCNLLEKITIPGSVTKMGESAFFSCKSLKTVTIENGISEIPINCFQSCTNLETVVLPESIILINPGAFEYCPALTLITIPSDNVFISSTSFSSGCDTVVICKKGSKVDSTIASLGLKRAYLEEDNDASGTEIPTILPTEIPLETIAPETEAPTIETEFPFTEPPVEATSQPIIELPKTSSPTENPTIEPTVKPTEVPVVTSPAVTTKAPTDETIVLKKKTIKIGKGEKVSFPLSNKTGKKVKYRVKNKNILSVSSKGVIKGNRVGETKIYATVAGKKFVLYVKVKKKPVAIKISSVSKVRMSIGGKLILQASMNSGAASYKLKWYSSNKKVVTVNNLGVATIQGKGRAVIKVKTYNGVTGSLRLCIK